MDPKPRHTVLSSFPGYISPPTILPLRLALFVLSNLVRPLVLCLGLLVVIV